MFRKRYMVILNEKTMDKENTMLGLIDHRYILSTIGDCKVWQEINRYTYFVKVSRKELRDLMESLKIFEPRCIELYC